MLALPSKLLESRHCTDTYTLSSELRKGDVSSYTSTDTPFFRQFLSIKIKNEGAFILCDMEQ